ncbi:MAG: hypothetical protein Q8P41_20135 [Pseudomonadota bacterium]|nr:hypothetical protein [Pseudomonadota bacterium]
MTHPYVFRNYAGINQLEINDAEDLARMDTLDKARWAATSAPVEQLFCDPAFLAYVDTDGNKRIRVHEMKAARRWLWARLANRERMVEKTEELRLADLDPAHADAAKVKLLAERLLVQLGAEHRDRIRLEQVRQFRASYSSRFPNGDGIVPPSQVADAPLAELARKVLVCAGGAPDLSGESGVRVADVDTWIDHVRAFLVWHDRSDDDVVLPLGADTAAACELVDALAPKVVQFFAQCALVSLEANAAARLQATPEELARLDVSDPVAIDAWLAQAPLARPDATGVLHLDGALNPRYAAALRRLATDVGPRVLGRPDTLLRTLSPVEWSTIDSTFAVYRKWRTERPPGIASDAHPEALKLLAEGPLPDQLRALCLEDLRVADELVEFNNLEKLVLYQRWLLELANNFVSFPSLFVPTERTLFEMGTLILDGRKLLLCVRVTDRAAHKKIAETSLMFLAYVEIVRRDGATEVRDQIAAAVTAGMRGGISVGKRGVFYDREDREWDATVVDLVEHPISIWEAMIAPFVRIRDGVVERVSALISTRATELETKAADSAQSSVTTATTNVAAAAKAPGASSRTAPKGPEVTGTSSVQGLLVGGSFAFAAIGSSLAFVVKTVADIVLLDAVIGMGSIVVTMAAVFGLLGWLKLRRRDLSALLEACGWALNGRMRLTHYLSLLFTQRPGLPRGSRLKRQLPTDPTPALALAIVLVLSGTSWYVWTNPTVLGPLAHYVVDPAVPPTVPPAVPPTDAPTGASATPATPTP